MLFALAQPTAAMQEAPLPRSSHVPGGVARIVVAPVTGERKAPPQAWLGDQRVLVIEEGGQWLAIVGLALDTAPGPQELRVHHLGDTRRLPFTVDTKQYPEQRITLKDTGKVQPSDTDLARIALEIAEIKKLKTHWRDTDDTDTRFALPAKGRLSGRFGVRRFFNGEARSPHAGFDIAAPHGSAVTATARGVVLNVGDYFFNGKTVFVDHGNGLISMYCHLDRIDVAVGDTVNKSQRLGLVGMTGRATGPHLHWSVILNSAMVDPALFVPASAMAR
jgi:murein DD-endopeptidase MepM/ murein hydrolase activator NlpD